MNLVQVLILSAQLAFVPAMTVAETKTPERTSKGTTIRVIDGNHASKDYAAGYRAGYRAAFNFNKQPSDKNKREAYRRGLSDGWKDGTADRPMRIEKGFREPPDRPWDRPGGDPPVRPWPRDRPSGIEIR